MRPRKLILENIGPFRGREELDFTRLGDIFLISGKTGSGKSTIFDALCYALYGTLCGGRKGQVRKLRSDFAGSDDACSVILEFELGSRIYRVERQPPRFRQKARGEGWIEDGEEAVLFEVQGSTLIPLSGKKTEADGKIQALVGLSPDEFSKIVLLPQGEFAEFLRQNTRDRAEVLKKLFPVDLAVRVRERAQDLSREAGIRLTETERTLRERLELFNPDTFAVNQAEAQKAVEDAATLIAALEKRAEETAGALRAANLYTEALGNVQQAQTAVAAVAEREALAEADRARLTGSRSARPLEAPLLRAREAASLAADRDAAYARSTEELSDAQGAMAALAADAGREAALETGLKSLHERRAPLEEAVSIEDGIRSQQVTLSKLVEEQSGLNAKKAISVADSVRRNEERTALERKAERLPEAEKLWEEARNRLEAAKARKELAEQLAPLAGDQQALEVRKTAATKALGEARKNLAVLGSELAGLEESRKATEAATAAAALALTLEKGKPCPVCGALEHPLPAMAPPMAFGIDERIRALKAACDDGERSIVGLETELRSIGREEERVARDKTALEARTGVSLQELPRAEEAAEAMRACHANLNERSAEREDARRAQNRLTALFREQEVARAAAEDLEAEIHRKGQERALLEAEISRGNERREKALSGLPAGSSREALERCMAETRDTEEGLRLLRKRREEASQALVAAKERHRGAQKAHEEALEAQRQRSQALTQALAASPFQTEAALAEALLPLEEERALEESIAALNDERRTAEARLAEATRNLEASGKKRPEGTPTPDILTRRIEDLKGEREAAQQGRDRAFQALTDLERNQKSYTEAEQRRNGAATEAGALKRLADDLSGKNPKNRSFDAWLLGLYLEEVTSYASHRLQRMSEGRYRLILDSEREGGRALAGLDLAVFDAYTGHSRPCATLSGGESFMASISLALGLADSIQARSGGIRLDAIFIDEGFGSLDEASLDKAMGILDEIRDQRMVALISHVGEMKSRIPSRVEILKTTTGSRIQVADSAAGA